MNKELEEWIELNVQAANTSYEGFWWKQGAKAMAEYLSNSENANNCDTKPNRWRAEEYESYWYIDSSLEVFGCTENNSPFDDGLYNVGNYFKTEEAAKAMAEKIKKILRDEEETEKENFKRSI